MNKARPGRPADATFPGVIHLAFESVGLAFLGNRYCISAVARQIDKTPGVDDRHIEAEAIPLRRGVLHLPLPVGVQVTDTDAAQARVAAAGCQVGLSSD